MIQMRFTPDSAAEFKIPNTASVVAAFRYTAVCDDPEGKYDGCADFFIVADGLPAKIVTRDGVWYLTNVSEWELRERGAIDSGSIYKAPCGCVTQYLSEKEVMEFLEHPVDIQFTVNDPEAEAEDRLDKWLYND